MSIRKTIFSKKNIFITLLIFALIISISSVSASESDNINLNDGDSLDTAIESDMSNDAIENIGEETILNEGDAGDSSNDEISDDTTDPEEEEETVSITAKDITKYYKGTAKYSARLLDGNGNAIPNRLVSISFNNKVYNVTSNSEGYVTLAIDAKVGTYKIVVKDLASGTSFTSTVKILSTIKSKDISKVAGDSRRFKATFLRNNGKVLAYKYIKFKINGKTYKVKTNGKGVASLSLKSLKKGSYKIISYNTDGLSAVNYVKVVKTAKTKLLAKNYVFLIGNKKVIRVTLHNQFDYAPGSGKIIKFTVNGKSYSKKTNSKGVARLTLPKLKKGSYTVKYSFAGTKIYKASSAKRKVIVLPNKSSKLTIKSTKVFGYGANTKFKVQLTASGIAIPDKKIIIRVNNKDYTKVTDNSGMAYLTIKLKVGHYPLSYKFNGDSKVNPASGKTDITVRERTVTNVTWKSSNSFYQGTQYYYVLLTDLNNNKLANKALKLTVNNRNYQATTNDNGIAKFTANVHFGNFTVYFSFAGDNYYAPSSNKQNISVAKRDFNGYGYWLFSTQMNEVNLELLAQRGTSDIFLNYKAFTRYGEASVLDWIEDANELGLRVHIWMQTFHHDDTWINPVKKGAPNYDEFNKIIAQAKHYASLKGVSGIHFDYLRYPGNAYKTKGSTNAISTFVKKACTALHSAYPKIIVSAAIMPEKTKSAYYYGQDYAVISKYMDVVMPMIYKGNYHKSTSWITTTTQWYKTNSKGAKVWGGIQSYRSDDDLTKLSYSELRKDSQAVLDGNGDGIVIFRWGLSQLLEFFSI